MPLETFADTVLDGPVVSLQLGTSTLILLGSATAVNDLLEKKGSIYSTRRDTFFNEFGDNLNIAFRPLVKLLTLISYSPLIDELLHSYDAVLRRQRKVYAVRLNGRLANNFLPYQVRTLRRPIPRPLTYLLQYFETHQLLHELLESPQDFARHLERFTISIGSTIAYGRRVPSSDVPLVKSLLEVCFSPRVERKYRIS